MKEMSDNICLPEKQVNMLCIIDLMKKNLEDNLFITFK